MSAAKVGRPAPAIVMGSRSCDGAVQPDDECGEGREVHVVELVDREQDPGAVVAGHLADLDEQAGQVGAELTGVGRPEDGVDVDAQLGPVGDAEA